MINRIFGVMIDDNGNDDYDHNYNYEANKLQQQELPEQFQ